MPNKVEFQKGSSLSRFLAIYGAEKQCPKKLFQARRQKKGYECPRCGHNRSYSLKSYQLHQCIVCRNQSSLKRGTIFASSKLLLTTRFLAFFFITQSKENMSLLSLRRFLGLSVDAALKMKHKLQHVMKSADTIVIEGFVELDDVYWGGKRNGKRGRGVPDKTLFLAAVTRNEKGHPIHMRMSKLPDFPSSEVAFWARKHLNRDSVGTSADFSPFNCISDFVSFHGFIRASEIIKNPENKIFHWVNTMIGN